MSKHILKAKAVFVDNKLLYAKRASRNMIIGELTKEFKKRPYKMEKIKIYDCEIVFNENQ